ncbi:unnamed protein product [Prorocentrum cordatum]|uniref:RNA helicase n=1 Tax=Prorocentrum cordatum TaxID=2364126 RepID=A0ABN9S5W6_9DINO|nr:unnamed protein product [Polarella glacialis]
MADINAEVAANEAAATSRSAKAAKVAEKPAWDELQGEDTVASYFEAYERGPRRTLVVNSDGELEEVEEANTEQLDRRNEAIEPLPAVDHAQIKYNPVQTEFYKPHPEVAGLDSDAVDNLRKELRVSATGLSVPSPVASFGHLAESLGKELMGGIRRHGYHQPTAIQAQAVPAALSGRDVIGIAETGSGKTVAYLLPMLVHTVAQPALKKDEGPIGIVLCPTRELAVQIEMEVAKFNKPLGLRSVTLAGGLSKLEQFKEVKRGCEIAICNPGRLIDIVKMKGCTLQRVTFVVIDEADRMFHMGFEYQVRSVVQNVRPSRQTLLFSATFPPKIERLARDLLQQPVRITTGQGGQAAANIVQHVEVLKSDDEKWDWMSKHIDGMLEKGQVLVFVKSIASAEELTQNFTDLLEKKTEFLHGDLDQTERMRILRDVKRKKVDVLIATDVAARGLDIPSIAVVVSYDVARDAETHTHRIGRTGRAGAAGEAYTLITADSKENYRMAALLVANLEAAGQEANSGLQWLAMKYGPYKAAKLTGQQFDGKKKKAAPKAVRSNFGVGFDGAAQSKETREDLERRLNTEADRMVLRNRAMLARVGGGRGHALPPPGGGTAGFVAAATEDAVTEIPGAIKPGQTAGDSSSDEDLFAPGVKAAFGKAAPAAPRPVGAQKTAPSPQAEQEAQRQAQQLAYQAEMQRLAQQQQQLREQQEWEQRLIAQQISSAAAAAGVAASPSPAGAAGRSFSGAGGGSGREERGDRDRDDRDRDRGSDRDRGDDRGRGDRDRGSDRGSRGGDKDRGDGDRGRPAAGPPSAFEVGCQKPHMIDEELCLPA